MYAMHQIEQILNQMAPPELAESWDNVGLLIGDRSSHVSRILCALDITEEVVDEAIEKKVQCIVSHHPFIFSAFKKIDLTTPQGRMIKKLIKHDINVIAMHTNFDIVSGGMNDYLVARLGLKNSRILDVTGAKALVKVVIYVPQTHFELVRDTLITWNPYHMGNYSGCTFSTKGEGTFKPEQNAQPYIGTEGELTTVQEMRFEFVTYKDQLTHMMEVLKKVHPYEEIAWDAFTLENIQEPYGLGRVAECEAQSVEQLINQIKEIFNIPYVKVVMKEARQITKIAICSGSGRTLIQAAAKNADVYITGDIGFHDAQSARDAGLIIIDIGHYASENIGMEVIQNYLTQHTSGIEVLRSEIDGEVFKIY